MYRFTLFLVFLLGLLVAGCSNGGEPAGTGTISLVLTDSATDELTQFEVDVSNVVLTRLSGVAVGVMPRATRVDFVDLESVNELVAGASLQAGIYTRVTMTLDFTNARVLIAGQTTPATVRDLNGAAITGPVLVQVDLTSGARAVFGSSRNHLFSLDLDLDQSITVDSGANEITFTPVLNVEVDPGNPKPIVTSGVLQSVDTNALTFVVERRAVDDSVLGTFSVTTTGSTVFQLGGVVLAGAPGLGSLVGNIGQYVYVQGTLDVAGAGLVAVAVESGAGVPGNGQDWVLGHVVARTGGPGSDAVLTVLGRSLDVGTSTRTYNTQHTVNVSSANTKVLRRAAGNSLDTDSVNIGQLVFVFGDLLGTTLDATAQNGVVRMLRTGIFGIATGAPTNDTLTLDVTRFDLRDVGLFDFTVAGQAQADPDAFTVEVTGLATSGIATGSRIRVLGWVSAVGSTDEDATALSIADRTTAAKVLVCVWNPATSAAVQPGAATAITLDVTDADVRTVGDGFAPVTLTASPAPTIQALGSSGFYRIVQDGQVTSYRSFPSFLTAVNQRAAASPVLIVCAFGTFDAPSQAFSALTATVVLD